MNFWGWERVAAGVGKAHARVAVFSEERVLTKSLLRRGCEVGGEGAVKDQKSRNMARRCRQSLSVGSERTAVRLR